MAKKKVLAVVKIQIPAGQASPAPPVGTALGPHGVAIMDFCKEYNARTESQRGTIVPVEISIYEDRTFSFVTKTPPAPVLIRQAARLDKGSQTPGKGGAVGQITDQQVTEIAQTKLPDLNTDDIDAAKLQIAGTARSMGIRVVG
jgi:large subunit ribosomal protein L11